MDYGKSFTYVFDDEQWVQKLLIGGILSMIPIVNLVVIGYALRLVKNVASGVEKPLPQWDDFGDYFVKGVTSVLASAIWALPIIAVSGLTAVVNAITGYNADPNNASLGGIACVWSLSCLSGLYGLFLGIVLPAAHILYAVSGDVGTFFRFGSISKFITSNLGNYIIALLVYGVAFVIASFGVILCVVGVVFAEFWAILVGSHLGGQLYRPMGIPSSEPAAN